MNLITVFWRNSLNPLATPMLDRLGTIGVFTPEMVGAMVRNATLDYTLNLHTSVLPSDLIAERVHTLYAASTVGHS